MESVGLSRDLVGMASPGASITDPTNLPPPPTAEPWAQVSVRNQFYQQHGDSNEGYFGTGSSLGEINSTVTKLFNPTINPTIQALARPVSYSHAEASEDAQMSESQFWAQLRAFREMQSLQQDQFWRQVETLRRNQQIQREATGIAIDDDLVQRMGRLSLNSTLIQPELRTPNITIHCVRHAQAEHNIRLTGRSKISNPKLTPHGEKQARYLATIFPHMKEITHFVCSPLERTLQTALIGFAPLLDRGLEILAWPDLREWGHRPCSTGASLADLQHKYGSNPAIDLAMVPEGWEVNMEGKCRMRAARVRSELLEFGNAIVTDMMMGTIPRQDVHILVVSHGGFLADLEGASVQTYHNTQWKSYNFAAGWMVNMGISPSWLVQTPESMRRVHVHIAEERVKRSEKI